MRIHELQIDRFGIWQDVKLPLRAHGLTVFYGPNEAGKSTLMRFIRGVLYGYQARDEKTGGPQPKPIQCAGALRIEHDGTTYQLRRTSVPGTRGRLEINGRVAADHDPLLEEIVGGASESLFENVFAIGLHELQQLATLNADEIARHIYGLSLGPDGQRILSATQEFSRQREQLIATDGKSGRVVELLRKLESLDQQLHRLTAPADRYNDARDRNRQLDKQAESLKKRQQTLQQNLRGHQFLLRAWSPWNKQRSLQKQLDKLNTGLEIRPEMLDRYDEVELELNEHERRRRQLGEESRRLHKQYEAIKLRPELEEHGCEIKALGQLSAELRKQGPLIAHSPVAHSSVAHSFGLPTQPPPERIHSLLQESLTGWTIDRLGQAPLGPGSLPPLYHAARNYQSSARNRERAIKRYKHLATAVQTREREWNEQSKHWRHHSPAEIRLHAERRMAELEDLRDLRLKREQVDRTLQVIGTTDQQSSRQLPEFFRAILMFFALAGIILVGAGLYAATQGYVDIVAGGPTAWIVGGCFVMLGIAALAISRALQDQAFARGMGFGDFTDERQRLQRELERLNQSIQRLTRTDALRPPLAAAVPQPGEPDSLAERDLLAQIREDLLLLDNFEKDGQRLERDRRRLAAMRQALQTRQRDVSNRRREWTESLKRLGLAETLKLKSGLRAAEKLVEARALHDDWSRSGRSDLFERRQREDFQRRSELLAEALHGRGYRSPDIHNELITWNRELQAQVEYRKERLRLRQLLKEKKLEGERLTDRLTRLKDQRATLLNQLGVVSREEIVVRLKSYERRSELQRQLAEVRQELDRIARSEPELAIVEEDLLRFDPTAHEGIVKQIQRDLDGNDLELRKLYEQLGHQQRELREIEDDRSLASLRFERAQLMDALQEETQNWSAVTLADGLMGKLRERVQRNRQPELLQHASTYLRKLTCNKYHNIWTPLGDRRLLVDDDQQQPLGIEQLSSGTREQVFLSIRMAMIRSLAGRGTELPMVLDDVTVNFDQSRTEAAASTLVDLAEQEQQILLFTCHLHLSHIFEGHGIEPVWLPGLRTNDSLLAKS